LSVPERIKYHLAVHGTNWQLVTYVHCKPFQVWFFSWQDFNWHSASRGPSAVAELLSILPWRSTHCFAVRATCDQRAACVRWVSGRRMRWQDEQSRTCEWSYHRQPYQHQQLHHHHHHHQSGWDALSRVTTWSSRSVISYILIKMSLVPDRRGMSTIDTNRLQTDY